MAKSHYRHRCTAMRYVKPGAAAVAKVAELLDITRADAATKPDSTGEPIVSGDLARVGRQMRPGMGCGRRRTGR
jgi:hypothetical protein